MKVHWDLDHLPAFKNAVITIGSFDGVHRGHQRIIEKIRQLAQGNEGESVVITFHPHPRQIVYPKDDSLKLLNTTHEKIRLLEQYGVDHVVVVPFTVEFSQLSADEYIQKFLVGKFRPAYIVIGYDHRFGLNRQGDINYLRWYGKEAGYEVIEIARQEVDEIAVSSSKIRTALEQGDMHTAYSLMGHYYTLSGKVVHGEKIGSSIGYPTANISLSQKEKLVPPSGIFAAWVYHAGKRYQGMLYIGKRPTINNAALQTIEVNIFDFNEDIYGEEILIEMVEYLRADIKFESLEALGLQMSKDKENAEKVLAKNEKASFPGKKGSAKLAIVILNFNNKRYLQQFLPGIIAHGSPFQQIFVADNGSSDESLRMLSQQFPTVKRLDLQQNHGYAQGYNLALHQIDAEYYCLLNSDVEVSPNWLPPILEAMESDKMLAACQPKILDFNNKSRFEYAGASGGWLDGLGYPFCRGRIFGKVETDNAQYDDMQEVFWASGAALFVKAQLFHQLGGFDGDYFAHAEEIDLCWRMKRAGYKVAVVPQSVVYHVGGGTLSYNTPRKTYLNFRNTLSTIFKNEPAQKLVWLLLMRMILDGVAGALFLFQGKFAHIRSILQAHISFYSSVPQLLKKRRQNQMLVRQLRKNGRPNLTTGRYRGSVVWQYFALGKHRFQDLFQ
jgi:riboflavin kinase/FMN adenylyltransferase